MVTRSRYDHKDGNLNEVKTVIIEVSRCYKTRILEGLSKWTCRPSKMVPMYQAFQECEHVK